MSAFTSSTCLQFTDGTTPYKRCKVKVKGIFDCANALQHLVFTILCCFEQTKLKNQENWRFSVARTELLSIDIINSECVLTG